ncbi:hypothetical protein ACOME3_001073 [Neoechinorhynchus agilis]
MSEGARSSSEKGPEIDVRLTLSDVMLPSAEMLLPNPTPSSLDGLSALEEREFRALACDLIRSCGVLLNLPQPAMATAQLLFHRAAYARSIVRFRLEYTLMGALTLAAKINECSRRIRDVINVFKHVKQLQTGAPVRSVLVDQHYTHLKEQVIRAERRILKDLGFCVFPKQPHKILISYLRLLKMEEDQELVQKAWNFLNDSFMSDVHLRFPVEKIVCACIFVAARQLEIPMTFEQDGNTSTPQWYELFGLTGEQIKLISLHLLRVYTIKFKPLKTYFQRLDELKVAYDLSRQPLASNSETIIKETKLIKSISSLIIPLSNKTESRSETKKDHHRRKPHRSDNDRKRSSSPHKVHESQRKHRRLASAVVRVRRDAPVYLNHYGRGDR